MKRSHGVTHGELTGFVPLRRMIYNMCTQKPPHDYSEQLYSRYRDAFNIYINETVRSANLHLLQCVMTAMHLYALRYGRLEAEGYPAKLPTTVNACRCSRRCVTCATRRCCESCISDGTTTIS